MKTENNKHKHFHAAGTRKQCYLLDAILPGFLHDCGADMMIEIGGEKNNKRNFIFVTIASVEKVSDSFCCQ